MTTIATYALNVVTNVPVEQIGALAVNERLVGSGLAEVVAFKEIVVGDTLCAKGFKSGGQRKVIATTIANGIAYVLTSDGWYTWPKVYAHVI